jgi:hypothetical protein
MVPLIVAAAWLTVGAGLCAVGLVAEPLIGMFVGFGWMASGILVLGFVGWRSRTPGRRLRGTAVAVVTMASGFAISVSEPWLRERGTDLHFAMRRAQYQQIAVDVVRAREGRVGEQSSRGIKYLVDAGPPVRVAFLEPGGIVDNWCAVIYDSSGSLRRVNEPVSRLFGGDLVACRRLDSVFFRCCFT